MIVPPESTATRNFTLLLVEDNEINARLMATVLESRGHQVVHAENGQIALDLVVQQRFDVIIMDMQMPVMDGVEATRAIRAMQGAVARTPIIGLTADATEDGRAVYDTLGLDYFLTKPVDWPELTRALDLHASQPDLQPEEDSQGDMAADNEAPLLDEDFFNDLIATLPQDQRDEILGCYFSTCPKLLTQIEQELQAGDKLAAAKTCHSLAGQSLGFGATFLGQNCKQAEHALKAGDEIDFARLSEIHDRTLAHMKQRVDQGS